MKTSHTDKQVCTFAWRYELEPTPELEGILLNAARERGFKSETLSEQTLNELVFLCGYRSNA